MTEQSNDRQDPAEPKKVDTATETEAQPDVVAVGQPVEVSPAQPEPNAVVVQNSDAAVEVAATEPYDGDRSKG